MQILVLAVGGFGVTTACEFFQHLIIEHNLLDTLQHPKPSSVELMDHSLFFTESGSKLNQEYRANLLMFDTTDDPYLRLMQQSPLLIPFVNQSQIIQIKGLTGVSAYQTFQGAKRHLTIKELIRNALKKELEKKSFQSVLIFHSISGGTGSGLMQFILADLQLLKNKSCSVINVTLIPSSQQFSTNSLEWYNAASALEALNDACDLTIMFDNQALHRVYQNSILGNGTDDGNIRLKDLNHLIVMCVSSLTSSQRYKSEIPKRLSDIVVNTVLYRCLHFVVPSLFDPASLIQNYAQTQRDQELQQQNFMLQQKSQTEDIKKHIVPQIELQKRYKKFKCSQPQTFNQKVVDPLSNYCSPISILVDLYDSKNSLATCEDVTQPPKDKFVSTFTSFNVPHSETYINQAFVHSKEFFLKATSVNFMSMSPCPYSFSLTHQSTLNTKLDMNNIYVQDIEMGACMLQNKFTIHKIFDRIHKNVSKLYHRGAYSEWIDTQEMQHHIDSAKCLERDYGDWYEAEEIVHLFEESLRDEDIQSQSDSLSESF